MRHSVEFTDFNFNKTCQYFFEPAYQSFDFTKELFFVEVVAAEEKLADMVKLYHYTHERAALSIGRSRVIKKSTV